MLDEMRLRTVAAALRTSLPRLIRDQPTVDRWDAELAGALALAPGRALPALRRLLLEEADPRLTSWVRARLQTADVASPVDLRAGDPERGAAGVDGCLLTMWLEERDEDDDEPLLPAKAYTAVLTASTEGADARYIDEAEVAAADLPADGVLTRWVVTATDARLGLAEADHGVELLGDADDARQARFSLVIPESGDAARRRLLITPLSAPEARMEAEIYIGTQLYRRLAVSLLVAEPAAGDPVAVAGPHPAVATLTVGRLPAAHAGRRPAAEWQRPVRRMTITALLGTGQALVRCDELGLLQTVSWPARPAEDVRARVIAVRTALDELRQADPDYFETISAERLQADLDLPCPPARWDEAPAPAADHEQAWARVADSTALRRLAYAGSRLYDGVFEPRLRTWLAQLGPGDLLDLTWLDEGGAAAPHLPLAAMYAGPVDVDSPVDAEQFLGLRHRLAYTRRQAAGSRSLGSWTVTTRAHILYDGREADDAVSLEAKRHAVELERWTGARFLPATPKKAVARFLAAPEPAPVSLLYFYCHCTSGPGTDPYLRLGPTNDDADVLRGVDLGTAPFADAPIVFVNACGSATADPLLANQLTELFLDRQCRAYIGTEARVPPAMAARFATVLFGTLYGTTWNALSPVGEAMAQARRFLWVRYRNLGGLFYTCINDYSLYLADDAYVTSLAADTAD